MTLGNQTVAGFVSSSLQTIQFLLTLMVVIVKVNLGKKRPDLGNVTQPHRLWLCFLFCHLKLKSFEIEFNFGNLFTDWTDALEKYTAILTNSITLVVL